MTRGLLKWDVYEITTAGSPVIGVSLRGRLRKFGMEQQINVLTENSADLNNSVRFAVLSQSDARTITNYVAGVVHDVTVQLVAAGVVNPVLSKLDINEQSRYNL